MLLLDLMLSKDANKALLLKALEKEFRGDPVAFFKSIIMPLLPQRAMQRIDELYEDEARQGGEVAFMLKAKRLVADTLNDMGEGRIAEVLCSALDRTAGAGSGGAGPVEVELVVGDPRPDEATVRIRKRKP